MFRHPFPLFLRTPSAWFFALLVSLVTSVTMRPAQADTVASLLGNFTINQFAGIEVDHDRVKLHFVVVLGQLPALTALHKADSNDDGVTSQAERDAYVKRLAPGFADKLKLNIGGKPVPLRLVSWTSSLPSESTGFSLRFDAHYVGILPVDMRSGIRHLRFDNTNYDGQIGWHEIVVKPVEGMSIFDTNAASTSLTDGLSINPKTLPPGGPLDERAVYLAFADGSPPSGAVPLAPRGSVSKEVASSGSASRSGIQATGVSATWLNHATKQLVDLISARHVAPGVALLALLIAAALGALHAFSPGHGKTVVGAYLIGSRGTMRHAVFLGLTVTVTHTLGVFALGLATLVAAQFVVPARLFPILSLISGLLVVVIGVTLFVRRLRGIGGHTHDEHRHVSTPLVAASREAEVAVPLVAVMAADANAIASGPVHESLLVPAHAQARGHIYEHAHDHVHGDHPHQADHSHDHSHEHGHTHAHHHHEPHVHSHDHAHAHTHETLTHSHGGHMHTHLPPGAQGESVTWRSLLGLGISGGLIPCPSAMVLLLAAVALHKTAYGLVLVLAFSLGLAITLSAVGMVFLYARRLFTRARIPGRLVQVLPVVSAGIITCIGLIICYGAIAGVSIGI